MLTTLFGITAVTVKKIYKCLEFVVNKDSADEVSESDSEEQIAQKKCPRCGNLYDIDYPKCPFCKYNDNPEE